MSKNERIISIFETFMTKFHKLSEQPTYSIFKEEWLEFRYNTVSTSVSLGEISLTRFLLYIWNANIIGLTLTYETAGSCGLFWIKLLYFLIPKLSKIVENVATSTTQIYILTKGNNFEQTGYNKMKVSSIEGTNIDVYSDMKNIRVLFSALRNYTVATTLQMALVLPCSSL